MTSRTFVSPASVCWPGNTTELTTWWLGCSSLVPTIALRYDDMWTRAKPGEPNLIPWKTARTRQYIVVPAPRKYRNQALLPRRQVDAGSAKPTVAPRTPSCRITINVTCGKNSNTRLANWPPQWRPATLGLHWDLVKHCKLAFLMGQYLGQRSLVMEPIPSPPGSCVPFRCSLVRVRRHCFFLVVGPPAVCRSLELMHDLRSVPGPGITT